MSLCARCGKLPRAGADSYCTGCRLKLKWENQNKISTKRSRMRYLQALADIYRPKGTRR